ncbi:MAG: glycosyltransferase family 61 protein [Deltaproteobacteria bacterium]|nr:MAG: glycosyltransferase family 61 protein [Deltaproteobacteria bacterium]
MPSKVNTVLPRNLEGKELSLFVKRKYYTLPKLKAKFRKNLFITHYGIAMKGLFPVRRTLPNTLGFFTKPNAGFFFKFWRKGIETFLVAKYGKSLKCITLSTEKTYLFAHSPWFGYFSWVTESLPRIYSLIERHEELTLILPESYSKKPFVTESLQLFPNLKYEIIPDGVHMKVPNVVIPELKPYTYVFDASLMCSYRKYVSDFTQSLELKIDTPSRIFISRANAKNRKLVNQTAVDKVLAEFEIQELSMEDFSFFEQVHLMNNCRLLTGVHGAGFANVCFLPEGSDMIEFVKIHEKTKQDRPSYWRLCSALGIGYSVQYCEPETKGNYDLWISVNLIADINKFKQNLELILS